MVEFFKVQVPIEEENKVAIDWVHMPGLDSIGIMAMEWKSLDGSTNDFIFVLGFLIWQ